MTLATGATTDGNGGWASVRFNGKSNQQNYLNYDGVDGSYVWDASPGYLNATGSQFRLQTSMESIAEFRVNSGLAPAESGLGAGGNITVISKSGSNRLQRLALQLLPQRRARLGEQVRRQEAGARVQPVRRVARRPDCHEPDVLLRQLRGTEADDRAVSFTEAVPSAEAIRRIQAGEPVGSGAGTEPGAHAGGRAAAGRVPAGHGGDGEPAARARDPQYRRRSRPSTRCRLRVDHRFTNSQSFYARVLYSDGDVDTPDRTVTPRRVHATQQPLNVVFNHQSLFGTQRDQRVEGRHTTGPRYDAHGVRHAGLRPDAGVALRHGDLAVDRRARHDRRRAQRPARPRHQQRVDQRPVLRPTLDRDQQRD